MADRKADGGACLFDHDGVAEAELLRRLDLGGQVETRVLRVGDAPARVEVDGEGVGATLAGATARAMIAVRWPGQKPSVW